MTLMSSHYIKALLKEYMAKEQRGYTYVARETGLTAAGVRAFVSNKSRECNWKSNLAYQKLLHDAGYLDDAVVLTEEDSAEKTCDTAFTVSDDWKTVCVIEAIVNSTHLSQTQKKEVIHTICPTFFND